MKMKMTNRSDEESSCTSPLPHDTAARLVQHDAMPAFSTPGWMSLTDAGHSSLRIKAESNIGAPRFRSGRTTGYNMIDAC